MQFSEFNLTADLVRGIEEAGYASCTEVQQETLSHTLSGKDVFVQSQTGTGKTAAFLISLFELIERGGRKEKALIVSPTRELAVQIAEEAKLLSLYLDYNIVTIFGGVGYAPQQRAIAEGIDLLIGTPGRLIDMSNKKLLPLSQFNYAVIDEADRMFDMGFVQDIQTILRRLPSRETRQTMLFSATLSPAVKRLASGSMNEPAEVHIESENVTVDTINQEVYHVGSTRKMELLLGLLKKYGTPRTLVFVNMKQMAEEVAERLRGNGFDAEYLTGDLAQRQRQRRIDRFKNNELPILVATDVAARGIHVDDLELVVNYDIPMHSENYVHRIGRTARAGKSGHAITLACEIFVEFLAPIEQFIKMKIPPVIAEEELYVADSTAGRSFRRDRRRPAERDRGSSRGGRHSGGSGGRHATRSDRGKSRQDSQRRNSRDGRIREGHISGSQEREITGSAHRRPEESETSRRSTGTRERNGEGRIPSSHIRDRRSFELQRHRETAAPPRKAAELPEKKRNILSRLFSFLR